MDKVSVVIPTFNRFQYLLNAIKSVKNQTYKNYRRQRLFNTKRILPAQLEKITQGYPYNPFTKTFKRYFW